MLTCLPARATVSDGVVCGHTDPRRTVTDGKLQPATVRNQISVRVRRVHTQIHHTQVGRRTFRIPRIAVVFQPENRGDREGFPVHLGRGALAPGAQLLVEGVSRGLLVLAGALLVQLVVIQEVRQRRGVVVMVQHGGKRASSD